MAFFRNAGTRKAAPESDIHHNRLGVLHFIALRRTALSRRIVSRNRVDTAAQNQGTGLAAKQLLIVGWKIDAENFRAVPVGPDGKPYAALELRAPFQSSINRTGISPSGEARAGAAPAEDPARSGRKPPSANHQVAPQAPCGRSFAHFPKTKRVYKETRRKVAAVNDPLGIQMGFFAEAPDRLEQQPAGTCHSAHPVGEQCADDRFSRWHKSHRLRLDEGTAGTDLQMSARECCCLGNCRRRPLVSARVHRRGSHVIPSAEPARNSEIGLRCDESS